MIYATWRRSKTSLLNNTDVVSPRGAQGEDLNVLFELRSGALFLATRRFGRLAWLVHIGPGLMMVEMGEDLQFDVTGISSRIGFHLL